jgi:hypothetical protein
MRLVKAFIVALVTLFAASTLQAATFVKPAGKLGAESGIELVKAKKGAKKKVKKAKKKGKKMVKKKGPGQCGTFMYHKKGKCVDARAKK